MADIAELERTFASNPTLDACLPLCEAYLEAKRFMEAMVVCKKGMKSAQQDARGPAMLVRVYAEQGKLPKAQKEADKAAAQFPQDAGVLEIVGRVHMLTGNTEGAVANLQQALQVNPGLVNARAWLGELGVAAPAATAQPPVPQQPGSVPPQQGLPQQPPGVVPPQMPGQAVASPPQLPAQQTPAPPPMPGQQTPIPPQGVVQQAAMPPQAVAPPSPFQAPSQEDAGTDPQDRHVSDFFAPDSLGFSGEGSNIETAGPGRLTIVGFVPKTTGSIKTTIMVLLGVITVAAVVLTYVYISSQNKVQINKLYGDVRASMAEDTFTGYQHALEVSNKILAIDDSHYLTLCTMAYAHAVLDTEHGQEGSLAKAKALLLQASEVGGDPNEWLYTAKGLVAYSQGEFDKGLDEMKEAIEGSSNPLIQMEGLRLRQAAGGDPELEKKTLARLVQSLVAEARGFNFLGWHYLAKEDYTRANKYFASALQNSTNHPSAMVGSVLVDLGRQVGLNERQGEIEENLKKVFALEKSGEISPPVLALAHFARAQLRMWQGKKSDAQKDYLEATRLDGKNPMLYYRRGVTEASAGNHADAVNHLSRAVELDPGNPFYLRALAKSQIVARDFAGAAKSVAEAKKAAPGNYQALILEGELNLAQDNAGGARAAFEQIKIDEHGGMAFAHAQIGVSQAYREDGEANKAVRHMKKFLTHAPESVSSDKEMQARMLCELGQAQEAAKAKADARESYKLGLQQYPFLAECHYFLARASAFRGEGKRACKDYLNYAPRGAYAADCRRKAR